LVTLRRLDQCGAAIEALLSLGHSQRFVASTLGVSPSTISREVRRTNTINFACYFATLGQRVRTVRRRSAGRLRRKLGEDVRSVRWKHVLAGLRQGWSPQQIAGRLRAVNCSSPSLDATCVSHETIYCAIYAQPRGALRTEQRKRQRPHPRILPQRHGPQPHF
jgi:transposase, IS30 family